VDFTVSATGSWGGAFVRNVVALGFGPAAPAPIPSPTATTVPPTATVTRVPPTATASTAPPTATARATNTPTATPRATNTPPPPTATSPASGTLSFVTGASVAPGTVAPGQTAAITASVTASRAVNALIDVEIYNAAGQRVYQRFWDNQALGAGAKRNFSTNWAAPGNAASGNYTVKVGVFNPGWGGMLAWNDNASSFRVGAAASTPTATPRATNTPTPRPTNTPSTGPLDFTTGATASPRTVARGSAVTIAANISANRATNALIDVEVYNAAGQRVYQRFWDNTALTANATRTLTTTWTPPANAAAGVYRVKIGIFRTGWRGLLEWNDNAATFTVR
jgi:hypothetical protein